MNKHKVITICGSMKHAEEMIAITRALTAGGNLVLFPFEFPESPINSDNMEIDNIKEELCWDVHKQRIEMSDAIYVVNINGYIGNHTKKNIEYAKMLDKEVIYHESIEED